MKSFSLTIFIFVVLLPNISKGTSNSISFPTPKDTISQNELLNCASKFFKIVRITDEGNYSVQVCNGTSGHLETEEKRQRELEGFCVSIITKFYKDEKFRLENEMISAVETTYNLKLGIEKGERLLRAQGALYMMMFQTEKLKEALLWEYEKQKENLGFVFEISRSVN